MNSPKHPPRMVLKANAQGIIEAVSLSFVFQPFPANATEYVSLAEHKETVSTLLEALKNVLAYLESCGGEPEDPEVQAAKSIRAAIAKAGG